MPEVWGCMDPTCAGDELSVNDVPVVLLSPVGTVAGLLGTGTSVLWVLLMGEAVSLPCTSCLRKRNILVPLPFLAELLGPVAVPEASP